MRVCVCVCLSVCLVVCARGHVHEAKGWREREFLLLRDAPVPTVQFERPVTGHAHVFLSG